MINIYESSQDVLAEKHYNAIVKELKKKGYSPPSTYTKWFKQFDHKYTFKHIITAKPKDLRIIMNKCQLNKYPPYIMELYNMYVQKFSKSDRCIGNNKDKYNAVKLMKSLRIKVCPLCNRNYINNVKPEGRKEKRTGQLDHFHDKATYPFLSMSFFNLVPACYGCNHTKGNYELDQTPYGDIELDPLIRFSIIINKLEEISDVKRVKVLLDNHYSIEKNVQVLGLKGTYTEEHNEDVYAVVKTVRNYSEIWKRSVLYNLGGLFKDEDDLRNIILGEYIGLKDRLKSKPLAKLQKDVYEQLEGYCRRSGITI